VLLRITPGISRIVILSCATIGASLITTPALAQAVQLDAKADAEATGPDAPPDAAAEAPAEPAAEPAPAPEPPPEVKPEPPKPPLFVAYGFIKPEIIVGQTVETFGKAIMVAPTAAAHPIADPMYGEAALSFQLQQSRVGLKINDGGPVSGRLEIDFIDDGFSHSTPIQGAGVRLRLAYITYKPGAGHTFMLGQNWDIFSPLNAQTMNVVGNSYQAGNSAFLRPQVAYTYGTGQGLEVTGAIGIRSQNTTAAINSIELGIIPTFALNVGVRKGKNWFGVSGIVGAEETTAPPARSYNGAFAANLFGTFLLSEKFTLIAEAYVGQNTNALGLLTLGTGGAVLDAGGFVSGNWKFAKMSSLLFTAGLAGVLNPADLAVGYTPAVAPVPPATVGTAAARVGIGGMESNVNLRATYVLSPLEGLQFYLEPYLFLTKHKLNAADDPTGSLSQRVAFGTQIGTRYNF